MKKTWTPPSSNRLGVSASSWRHTSAAHEHVCSLRETLVWSSTLKTEVQHNHGKGCHCNPCAILVSG
ncbi:hypothetical protein OJAV_G00225210 [Oryzias javanicus]|uniref:Uncharacterized protein n=1 Tax=Oryzias javanicus TaxID=123683 RepID=A0A437C2N4_ORYJA|nr:hypothetical protein OJAV_G00225210 [Oryzias javanicus]